MSDRTPTKKRYTMPDWAAKRLDDLTKQRGEPADDVFHAALACGLRMIESHDVNLLDYAGEPVEIMLDDERTPVRGTLYGENPEHVVVLNDKMPRFLPKAKIKSLHFKDWKK